MAKHALLIASPFAGLAGPVPDVERVAGLLEPRGFEIRRCVDQEATREGILTAYRSLIDHAGSGDAVAIYYSGHGARSLDEDYTPPDDEAPRKRYHQFIVPMDLNESSSDDFRGILSLELSSLLGQLTEKTRNVTVIFDCCHSGGMTRDLRLRLKTLPRDWFVGAHAHLERLKRHVVPGFEASHIAVTGNPYAVRVMAALPSQQAWEYEGPQGAYGLMTDALVTAFEESEGRAVSWDAIERRVRELVQRIEPGQYPAVEGPGRRFVFDLKESDLTGVVPARSSEDGPQLEGGRLLGIEIGDQYAIMPAGFEKVDAEHKIADAMVKFVGGAWSLVTLEPSSAETNLPPGAQAFPVSCNLHKRPVVVRVGSDVRPAIEGAIGQSALLRLASGDETEASPDVLSVVEESGGQIHIRERSGLDLTVPLPAAPGVETTVAKNLDNLARARRLETLESGSGACALGAEYELDWGRVVGGRPVPLPATGAALHVGDWIFVRVRNKSQSTRYVHVFDIGLAGRITLLTRSAPSGFELQPDGVPFTLGYREPFGWKGLGPLFWPPEVPKDGQPRPESFVVVVADRPQNLGALESPEMVGAKGAEGRRSQLQEVVDQLATGQAREVPARGAPADVRYAVEHICALVDPTEATIHAPGAAVGADGRTRGAGEVETIPAAAVQEVAPFLIDERPDPSAAYRRARGLKAPTAVALQLGEIVVHSNRALFSSDVRVDALVVTGGEKVDGAYRAGTAKFEHINDGDRLPLDNLLVYHGPANGFLDLAVWVSRDIEHSLSLMDLLKKELNSTEFKDAALVLAGLAVAAPTAGAVVAALGAATTVVNVAYKLLSEAVGKTIGLYRTSLLANERFGVGRHPASGMMRAQDFSFWYQLTEVA